MSQNGDDTTVSQAAGAGFLEHFEPSRNGRRFRFAAGDKLGRQELRDTNSHMSLLLGIALADAANSTGLKPITQAALQRIVASTAKKFLIPGALVLLRTPQGDFTVSYGTTRLGTAIPPRVDTYFHIASNSKTMTSAVILQLAQEGKLSLNDPVSKYVRDVPNGDKITIAELLAMRSGLYNYTDAPEFAVSVDRDPGKVWTPNELLAIAFKRTPNAPPGTTYEYNNTNYVLLGLVVERVTSKSLAAVEQERLFGPFEMRHTAIPPSNVVTMPEPYAHGYLYGSSSVALNGTPPYSNAVQAAARAGTLKPNDYTGLNYSFAFGCGGVTSTASDLATWIQALVAGRVLNTAYRRIWLESLRPEDPNKPGGQEYGYGIARLRFGPNAFYFHGGEAPGYNSSAGYDLTNHVTLVVWTNLTVSPDADQRPTANALMLNILDRIYMVSPLPKPHVTENDLWTTYFTSQRQ